MGREQGGECEWMRHEKWGVRGVRWDVKEARVSERYEQIVFAEGRVIPGSSH
jgi:hypothetical protein